MMNLKKRRKIIMKGLKKIIKTIKKFFRKIFAIIDSDENA